MSIQEIASTSSVQRLPIKSGEGQYTIWQILGIWLAGGAPMWLLGWVAYPVMSAGLTGIEAGMLRLELLTVGLVWEFVLAMLILYREEGNVRLSTISRRFWLNHPVSPKTGKTQKSLWWWLVPSILLILIIELGFRSVLINVWVSIFPFLAQPPGYDMSTMITPALRPQLVGAWGLLAVIFVESLFNTFLGEEFLFRGVLLPKMQGVFGRWDWVANAVVFGFYHLHQPWTILDVVATALVFAFTGRRFHSNWFPIILHSGQSVFILFLILGLVLGLA